MRLKCENFVRGREEGWVSVCPVLLGKYVLGRITNTFQGGPRHSGEDGWRKKNESLTLQQRF